MPKISKSLRRESQRHKARTTTRTSRAFLHTLDRLAAERDRAKRALYDDNGERRPGVTRDQAQAFWASELAKGATK